MNALICVEIDWNKKPVMDMHMLAEGMALRGHNVYVIDYESLWKYGEKSQRFSMVSRAFNGNHSWVCLIRPSFIKIPVVSRLSAFVSHFFVIRQVIKEKKIDAIVLYSVPTNGLQTLLWAKYYGIPVVFRSIDILNQLVKPKWLSPIVKMLEKVVYSHVDKILTLTPKLSDYVVKMGANYSKTKVLPMPVDTNLFHPFEPDDKFRQKWGISKTDKVILFMGTLYDFSGLDKFIPKLKYLVDYYPDVKLLIVGDGVQRAELERLIKQDGLENKAIITGFQPYSDMPQYINMATICINQFSHVEATEDIFPGKTVQFLACGKPLVSTPLAGMKEMIQGETQGVVYAENDIPIYDLLGKPELAKKIGQNGLEYVLKNHSIESVTKQLEFTLYQAISLKKWEKE